VESVPSAGPARLTEEPLFGATVRFGLPLVIAMALGAIFNLVDLWVVGMLPNAKAAVAGVGIASTINSLPPIIFNGIVNAMIALVARHHAMGNKKRANLAAGQGLLVTLGLGIVFGVPPWIFAEELCVLLGAQGAVVAPATDYLAIMSAGTVTMFLLLHVTGALRAVGNSTVPVVLLVGSNILNVALDFWWVLGGWGVPAMGAAGAAWATVASRGICSVIGLALIYRGVGGLRLRRFAWSWKPMMTILRVGIPSCGQWVVRMVACLYLMYFIAKAAPLAGEDKAAVQAAFSVGLRMDTLALFAGFGWGAAAATIVGQNLGRGFKERAVAAAWIALGLNMAMMLLFAGAFILFADPLIAFMGFAEGGDAESVRRIGRTYLYIGGSSYVFVAVALVLSQAMAGAGATKMTLILELLAFGALGYPLGHWAAANADWLGMRGLWLTAVAVHLVVAIAYMVWFRRGTWLSKELR
jgi:putative MATE family efflux protein